MIRVVLTLFAWLFMLDGALSVVNVLVKTSGRHFTALTIVHVGVALIALLVSLALYAACLFMPTLPKRFIIPATAFLTWANLCLAFPLSLWTQHSTDLILNIVQLLLGGVFLWWLRDRERGWLLANPAEAQPGFTWKNLLLFGGANVLIVPLFLLLWLVSIGVHSIQSSTAGFIMVRPNGIFLQERLFEKDNHRVHLVGMMHVADSGFYDNVLSSIPATVKSVVLLEGVTDKNDVLKGGDLGMRRISKLLGINSQSDSSFTKRARAGLENEKDTTNEAIRYVRADRDVSDFHPQTIACLNEISALAASKTFEEFMQKFRDPNSIFLRQENERILMDDILEARNQFILAKIEESAPRYDHVVVPWGAMHMPFLEQKLREKGYHEIQRTDRRAVAFF